MHSIFTKEKDVENGKNESEVVVTRSCSCQPGQRALQGIPETQGGDKPNLHFQSNVWWAYRIRVLGAGTPAATKAGACTTTAAGRRIVLIGHTCTAATTYKCLRSGKSKGL